MKLIPVHKFNDNNVVNANILEITYNNEKRPKKIVWLQKKKISPMQMLGENIYSIVFEYDKNLIIQKYLGKDNNMVNDSYGIAKIVTRLKNDNIKVLQSFFNSENQMVKDEYGNYQYQFEKGENNTERIVYSLDQNNKRINQGDGGYRIVNVLDTNGVVIKNIWQNKDGNITENDFNYAISELKYDQYYQLKQIKYLDINGKLCLHKNNHCAYVQFQHDDYGNKIENRYFGINNELTEDAFCNCSIIKYYWDNTGQPVKLERFDENEKIIEN